MSERLLTDAELALIVEQAKDFQRDEVYYGMEDEVLRLAADLQRCRAWLGRLVACLRTEPFAGTARIPPGPIELFDDGTARELAQEVRAALEEQAAPPASP